MASAVLPLAANWGALLEGDARPAFYLLLGFGAGLVFFFKGFGVWRKMRLIQDTPTSKIRSMALGRVELYGQAVEKAELTAPLTGAACVYYRYQVEQEVQGRIDRLLSVNGDRTVDSLHRELGHICIDQCGMSRNRAGLEQAIGQIQQLREEYWERVRVPGAGKDLNQSLEKAGRVADYFELAELMCRDALQREESCGTHFREEYRTEEGEARRDDERFTHVAAWEFTGSDSSPVLHTEALEYENVPPSQRSYK